MTIVVDASVALKWYFSEEGSEQALALLASGERLIAPDLVVAELCNGAWRLIRRGELRSEQLAIIAGGVPAAFATLHASASLAARAGGHRSRAGPPGLRLLLSGAERSRERTPGER